MDKDVAWNTSCAEGLAEVLYKVNYSMYCTYMYVNIFRSVSAFAVDNYNVFTF